jgi:hypothetical protein
MALFLRGPGHSAPVTGTEILVESLASEQQPTRSAWHGPQPATLHQRVNTLNRSSQIGGCLGCVQIRARNDWLVWHGKSLESKVTTSEAHRKPYLRNESAGMLKLWANYCATCRPPCLACGHPSHERFEEKKGRTLRLAGTCGSLREFAARSLLLFSLPILPIPGPDFLFR